MRDRAERIRVLHVDDDPEFTDLTATFLEREDERLVVENALGPKEGLERLADLDFDCIVSDHDMPYQDGIEFLKSVRESHPDIPFILFTGKGSEAVASEAISAGVTDYLQKESGTEQYTVLANRIAHAVEASLSREMLQERTRQLETLIGNLPGIVYRCESDPWWDVDTLEGEVEQRTGYTAEAIKSGDISWDEDIIHPEDREPTRTTVQEGLADKGSFEVTYSGRRGPVDARTGTRPVHRGR
jgi:CheY-like chemotaxis protein